MTYLTHAISFLVAILLFSTSPVYAASGGSQSSASGYGTNKSRRTTSGGYGEESWKHLYFGAGVIAYNMSRFGENEAGQSHVYGELYPDFNLSLQFDIFFDLILAPTASYTLFGKTSQDGTTTRILTLVLPVMYNFSGPFDFKAGPGVLWYQINGSGGGVQLPNGNSTATFYRPTTTVNSREYIFDIGVGAEFSGFRLDLDTFATSALTSRRAISTALSISYNFFN